MFSRRRSKKKKKSLGFCLLIRRFVVGAKKY